MRFGCANFPIFSSPLLIHQKQKGILGPQAIWLWGFSAPNRQKEKKNKTPPSRAKGGPPLPLPPPVAGIPVPHVTPDRVLLVGVLALPELVNF